MATSQQLQLTQLGGPMEVVSVPRPTPAADQVLIRVGAVALNALDWKQRDVGMLVPRYPHVLGVEGAGVVEAVGADVTGLGVGDEVAAWMAGASHGMPWGAAYQTHVVVPAQFVAKKPKGISLAEAASLPICYITAVVAINTLGISMPQLGKASPSIGTAPKSILILGGSSVIGGAAIQILRAAHPGLPILATSSAKHHAHLRALGATQAFDYRAAGDVVGDIRAASPGGRGVDMVLDCVGAGVTQEGIEGVLDKDGAMKYAEVLAGPPLPEFEGVAKYKINGFVLVEMPGGETVVPGLTALMEQGTYKLPVPVRVVAHGLAEIPNVMDMTKTVSGEKLVVTL